MKTIINNQYKNGHSTRRQLEFLKIKINNQIYGEDMTHDFRSKRCFKV